MKLSISPRDIVYPLLALALLWLLYLGRSILPPFMLAAGFAYILNPLIGWLHLKTKIPRAVSILIIYITLISALVFTILTIGVRLSEESASFSLESKNIISAASTQISALPFWLQPVAEDLLSSARGSFIVAPRHVVNFLPGVVNGTINILVFLVAAFYLLKDGHRFISGLLSFIPDNWHHEIESVGKKVNGVLGNYLRAQLLLVLIMSTFTFIGLSIIGVKYALVLSIFSGFAEIIPFVGPVVAAGLSMIVAYTDNMGNLGLDPISQTLAIAIFYTVLRQLEDYLIIPSVLGKMVKLHPLVVLFSVLLGGHVYGVLGFILAVPVVASLKVVMEHILFLVDHKNALQEK